MSVVWVSIISPPYVETRAAPTPSLTSSERAKTASWRCAGKADTGIEIPVSGAGRFRAEETFKGYANPAPSRPFLFERTVLWSGWRGGGGRLIGGQSISGVLERVAAKGGSSGGGGDGTIYRSSARRKFTMTTSRSCSVSPLC